jgi:chorismate mutase/prephenate dehydratase
LRSSPAALSHPQALAQCEGFFRAHPQIRAQAEFDTAGAARKVRQSGDRALGAIASFAAASTYGLEVLARGIQTQAGNSTRFVEVGLHTVPLVEGARAKSSLLLELADRPGVLGEILQELARRGLNLTKLESRPIPGNPWSYRFYLDIDGHASATSFQEALAALSALTTELRVLGTYPAAG